MVLDMFRFEMPFTETHGGKQALRGRRLDSKERTGLEMQTFRKHQTEDGFESKK